jgi:glycosyltransferase involved in cell wall biosynthesis
VVEEQKRFSLVLETMINACQSSPNIECWIVGDGSALLSAQKQVFELDLDNQFVFWGRLEPEATLIKLSECQALLLMSDYEGLPVSLLEAMSMGVVPITRFIPSGIPELVQHNKTGILVSNCPKKAAAEIISLMNQPECWAQYSAAARDLVISKYSEDICYKRWLEVIQRLQSQCIVKYPIRLPQHINFPAKLRRNYPLTFEQRVRRKLHQTINQVQSFWMRA